MPTHPYPELPDRGPGIKAAATDRQWAVLAKDAIATIHTKPDACEECAPYDGETMRLPEAEELLPQHPHCKCHWTYDWRPELRALPMTSLLWRASEHSTSMHDTLTKTTSTTDATIVKGTPTGKADDDAEYIRVPISSTNTDRDGDRFSEDGLRDLRDQIREMSKPVFENHGIGEGGLFGVRYDWKGIIGSQDDAEIEATGEDEETLYSFVKPNENSEEGQLLRSYVEAGMPVGLSIGFRALEFESNDDDEKTFHEADLLETSAVGIQSNQESVAGRDAPSVEAVAKGVAARFPDADLDEDTLATAIVSEASATGDLPAGDDVPLPIRNFRTGFDYGSGHDDREQRDHEPEHDHKHMDDDTQELLERQTAILENEQEKRTELEQRVGELEADDEGSGSEKDAIDGEGDGGDEGVELRELAEGNRDDLDDLRDDISEIKDVVTDGDTTPEDAETENKAPADDESGEKDADADTETTADGDGPGADTEGWM